MRADDGRVRVLDFGLARAAPSLSSGNVNLNVVNVNESGRLTPNLLETQLTRDDLIVGTPRFMAPEQHVEGADDEAADTLGLYVSLYWSLHGTFPYDGPEAARAGRLADPPEGSTVPRWLRPVLARGLAARPEARHPSMAALLDALQADPQAARRRQLRAALGVV